MRHQQLIDPDIFDRRGYMQFEGLYSSGYMRAKLRKCTAAKETIFGGYLYTGSGKGAGGSDYSHYELSECGRRTRSICTNF